MNRSIRIVTLAGVCIATLLLVLGGTGIASRPALAQTPGSTLRTITVTGTGTSYTSPDIAYLYIGVDIQNADLAAAMKDADSRMTDILAALKKADITDADIQTVQYNVYREQGAPMPKGGGDTTSPSTYHVMNVIRVNVHTIGKVGDVLNSAVNAGANVINNVEFSVKDTKANETTARKSALDDANAKATELAASIGATLGRIVSIQEGTGFGGVPQAAAYGMGGGGGGGPALMGGSLQVTVNLSVTYEIQ